LTGEPAPSTLTLAGTTFVPMDLTAVTLRCAPCLRVDPERIGEERQRCTAQGRPRQRSLVSSSGDVA